MPKDIPDLAIVESDGFWTSMQIVTLMVLVPFGIRHQYSVSHHAHMMLSQSIGLVKGCGKCTCACLEFVDHRIMAA